MPRDYATLGQLAKLFRKFDLTRLSFATLEPNEFAIRRALETGDGSTDGISGVPPSPNDPTGVAAETGR